MRISDSVHPAFLISLFLFLISQEALFPFSMYDMILNSNAGDNQAVIDLFFDQNLEDQVLVMKALSRRNELYFEDIVYAIRQRYSQHDNFKYEHLLRTLADALLEMNGSERIQERIQANAVFFDSLFQSIGSMSDPGCKSKVIDLMDYAFKPEYTPILLNEAHRIIMQVNGEELSAEHFLPEILAIMEYAERHLAKEFLYFGTEIITRIKDRESYKEIKNIINKLLE